MDLRPWGIMFRLPSLQSVITVLGLSLAGLGAYWLRDRLLVMIVGTLSWYLGGMAFGWAGMVTLYYLLTVLYIKNEAWHRKYDSIEPMREWPVIETPKYYESIIRGVDIDPKPPIPPDHFSRDLYSFTCNGIDEEHLHMLAHRVVNMGARIVDTEFVPHWNGFSRGKFRKFREKMVQKHFARWANESEHRESIQLLPSGADFLDDILTYLPTSPLDENWGNPP